MKKILVIVDMQHDFIDGSLGTIEAKAVLPRIANYINDLPEDTLFVFTRDTHPIDYLLTAEGKKLPVEHCIAGTHGWEIPEMLTDPFVGSPLVIDKPTFGSVDLMGYLSDMMDCEEDTEIEFCGLCTDICVISNVLMAKAFFPEAKIVVNSNLCAGVTPASHNNALEAMKMCQIDII